MVRPGTFTEIMGSSATWVDDADMSMRFPLSDWSGYFLFAAIDGDGPFHAVNLGLSVGLPRGEEVGVPQWHGDPDAVFVIAATIFDGTSFRLLDDTTYRRHDLIYSRRGLDVQVADILRFRGHWPDYELYLRDERHDIVYDLAGRSRYAHWVPDHVQRTNMYDYLCLPDFAFGGTIGVGGRSYPVSGVGGFDHVVARTTGSPSSPGIGFWHYDPIHWGGGLVSNGLYYLGAGGEPYIRGGVMTLPDGGYHPAHRFTIEYLETAHGTANAGSSGAAQVVPRRWRATMETDDGVLTYTTTPLPIRDPQGREVIEPNVAFAEGEFRGRDGTVLSLSGKGHNEYMGAALDPTRVR
jgi:hypothetical protein